MKDKFIKRGFLLFVFLLILGGTLVIFLKTSVSPPKEPVRVAFQICNSLEENEARFTPLARFMGERLGREVILTHVNTFDFVERAGQGQFDFIQSNGYIYVHIREEIGATLVAREVKLTTGKDTAGLIVTRSDSPVKRVEDLKGRKFVFGPVLSPGGYLTQYYTMLTAGLDPETDLEGYYFVRGSFNHEKVIYSILFGAYDGGAVKLGDLELMESQGKISAGDFKVVAESPKVPNCTFYALPHVEGALVEEMRSVLMALKKSDTVEVNGEVLNVLYRDGVEGYVPADDSEFDILREMAKKVGMPPYETY